MTTGTTKMLLVVMQISATNIPTPPSNNLLCCQYSLTHLMICYNHNFTRAKNIFKDCLIFKEHSRCNRFRCNRYRFNQV